MRAVVRAARAVWRVLWRSTQLEADMQEEMRFHLQQEADRLAQVDGLNPEEARRQAFVRFGGVEKYKEEGREAHGLYWLDGLSLDARLGVRMLIKHRWLTIVGGVAMTVAIAIGATAFEVINALLDPTLPFPIALDRELVNRTFATGISIGAFSTAGIGLAPGAALLVTVAAVITIVAAFAALGPARRSLRLPTVDALRADG